MEPPEPFERATASLTALAPGQFFHMQHRMMPRMLYPELAAMGLTEKTVRLGNDEVHIVVWSPTDPAASAAAEQCCAQLSLNIQI